MPKIITLTGPSGCGKSTVVNELLKINTDLFIPTLISKFTTRKSRIDDGDEIKCVAEIPNNCDMLYEQYGDRYGLSSNLLYNSLSCGKSPIIILNDIRIIDDLKSSFGEMTCSLFVFREGPNLENFKELSQSRGINDESTIEKRFRKAQSIIRIYIENIHLFDHVLLNSGSILDLNVQVHALVDTLFTNSIWQLKPAQNYEK